MMRESSTIFHSFLSQVQGTGEGAAGAMELWRSPELWRRSPEVEVEVEVEEE